MNIGTLAEYFVDQTIYQNTSTQRAFYKLKCPALGMFYGLKVIAVESVKEAKIVRNEVVAMNKLPFGLSAKCHQYWQEGNKHYLLMDWIEGQPLANFYRERANTKEDLAQRLSVAIKVAEKLSHIHRNRMLHRDIKPENIVINASNNNVHSVSLIDFGLTNQKRDVEEGTYQYQSPEQGFMRYVELTESSDIFSLCQVIHFLLCGQPLNLHPNFDSSDWDTGIELALPEVCPNQINTLLKKGLAFNPKQRLKNVRSVITELRNVQRQLNKRG